MVAREGILGGGTHFMELSPKQVKESLLQEGSVLPDRPEEFFYSKKIIWLFLDI